MRSIHHRELTDGQQFSPDGGTTWYTTAVPLFGNVAVYIDDTRTQDSPTVRIDVDDDGMVTIA